MTRRGKRPVQRPKDVEYPLKELEAEFVNHLGVPGLLVFRCPNCRGFRSLRLKPYYGGHQWTGTPMLSMTVEGAVVFAGHFSGTIHGGNVAVAGEFACRPAN
jgi:hypothetical protein